MAVDFRSYHLMHKSQQYDDDVKSEMQALQKKLTIQLRNHLFNGQDAILVINALMKYKWAYDSSRIHEGGAARPFRAFMSVSDLVAIKAQSTLLPNYENWRKGTIMSLAQIVNRLFTQFSTDSIITKADKEVQSFKQSPVTSSTFSQCLPHLTLTYGGVDNK